MDNKIQQFTSKRMEQIPYCRENDKQNDQHKNYQRDTNYEDRRKMRQTTGNPQIHREKYVIF